MPQSSNTKRGFLLRICNGVALKTSTPSPSKSWIGTPFSASCGEGWEGAFIQLFDGDRVLESAITFDNSVWHFNGNTPLFFLAPYIDFICLHINPCTQRKYLLEASSDGWPSGLRHRS